MRAPAASSALHAHLPAGPALQELAPPGGRPAAAVPLLSGSRHAGERAGCAVKVWAVEKNPNAVITLQQKASLHKCGPLPGRGPSTPPGACSRGASRAMQGPQGRLQAGPSLAVGAA